MLEKPEIQDEEIIACLENEYGLRVEQIAFLPLGADLNTAVYRLLTNDQTFYFVKLRQGDINRAAVTVPKYLSDLGIEQIIPPLPTQNGGLWASLRHFKLILYPYVEGRNGFERNLSDRQWVEFGTALKRFHSTEFPAVITRGIPREKFSPHWRDMVKTFLARIMEETFDDPVAADAAAFLKPQNAEMRALAERTEHLAGRLRKQPLEFILCHADIHAWNLLIADNGALYMVDWDTLIFAPKERDLMFVGGGLGGNGHSPQAEQALFFQGYGPTRIDPIALAYYRYERILEDIAVFCEQIFLADKGGEDRNQALEYLESNFLPNGVLEIARQSDIALKDD
jgi:spectinomycin phosphotransferase